jgi:hypothetical protein
MKTIIIIATILILSFNAFGDEFHEGQELHFAGEFMATVCVYKGLTEIFHVTKWKALVASSLFAVSLGVGKEVFFDKEVSGKDLLVDGAGIALGIGFVYWWEF